MPMQWNAEADAKLFAAFMATSDAKPNCTEMAKHMGPECTAKAISHRITAIRKLAKTMTSSESDGDGNTSSPAGTPKQAAVVKTGAGKRKKGQSAADKGGDDEHVDNIPAGPVKKAKVAKKTPKKKAVHAKGDESNAVKDESEEDGVDNGQVKYSTEV